MLKPALQTRMARFEPLKIDYGDYDIHVISDPHTLPTRTKNKIVKRFRTVTQLSFGRKKPAEVEEVEHRLVSPNVSLLLLVEHKQTKQFVGYLTTRVLGDDTIHVHASAFDPQHQNWGGYAFAKLAAIALERQKMQLHGKTPRYVSAQSPFPDVLVKLAEHDGMLPAHLHGKNRRALKNQASKLTEILGSNTLYEEKTGIRRGAIGFDARSGEKPQDEQFERKIDLEEIEKALRKLSDPKVCAKFRTIFQDMNAAKGDTVLSLRRFDREQEQRIRESEQLIHPHLQPMVMAELLLGRHRKYIGDIKVRTDLKMPGTNIPMEKMLELNIRPQNLDLNGLSNALKQEMKRRTTFGNMWKGIGQPSPEFRQIGPKILIPLGPMVAPFLQILRDNLINPRREKKK